MSDGISFSYNRLQGFVLGADTSDSPDDGLDQNIGGLNPHYIPSSVGLGVVNNASIKGNEVRMLRIVPWAVVGRSCQTSRQAVCSNLWPSRTNNKQPCSLML